MGVRTIGVVEPEPWTDASAVPGEPSPVAPTPAADVVADTHVVDDAGEAGAVQVVDARTGEIGPGAVLLLLDGPEDLDEDVDEELDADIDEDAAAAPHVEPHEEPPPVASAGFGQTLLNPAQQEVLALLGAKASERPEFDAELRHHLRGALEDGLAPLVELLPGDEQLFVSKYPLSQIHGCEDKFLADRAAPFAWNPSIVRGSVSHKAVELSLHWDTDPVPLELVDEAVARLTEGSGSLADWLQTSAAVDRAEVRAQANERVSKFLECFPPLKPSWRPVTESAVKVELFDRRIVLQGRVDLTLGHARGTTANKVLIDFKSGGFAPAHVDDLRFYALLEAVRIGTPPRMLATYYLDTGRPFPEAVTEGVLDAALHRTIDGATRMAHLLHGDVAPVRRSGSSCRWCPLLATCADGQAWIRRADDLDDVSDLDLDD